MNRLFNYVPNGEHKFVFVAEDVSRTQRKAETHYVLNLSNYSEHHANHFVGSGLILC